MDVIIAGVFAPSTGLGLKTWRVIFIMSLSGMRWRFISNKVPPQNDMQECVVVDQQNEKEVKHDASNEPTNDPPFVSFGPTQLNPTARRNVDNKPSKTRNGKSTFLYDNKRHGRSCFLLKKCFKKMPECQKTQLTLRFPQLEISVSVPGGLLQKKPTPG